MKKTVVLFAAVAALSGCQLIAQGDYIRPSDAVTDQKALVGKTGSITGFLSCNGDYCQLHEKTHLGMGDGVKIQVKLDSLTRDDRKFVLTKCEIAKPCSVQLDGKFENDALGHIAIKPASVKKLGMTAVLGSL